MYELICIITTPNNLHNKKTPRRTGFEPETFGLEVQRAIHCSTEARFPHLK